MTALWLALQLRGPLTSCRCATSRCVLPLRNLPLCAAAAQPPAVCCCCETSRCVLPLRNLPLCAAAAQPPAVCCRCTTSRCVLLLRNLPLCAATAQSPAVCHHMQAYLGSLVLSPPQLAAANALLSSLLHCTGLLPTVSCAHSAHADTHLLAMNPTSPGPLALLPVPAVRAPKEHAPRATCPVSTGVTAAAAAAATTCVPECEEWSRGDGEGGWGGVDVARVAHIDLTTSADAALSTSAPSSASAAAAAADGAWGSTTPEEPPPPAIRPCTALQPASWPHLLSGATLAADALTTSAARDVALLGHLAACACAAHVAAGAPHQPPQPQQLPQGSACAGSGLPEPGHVDLAGFAGTLPVQQRQLLAWLPPPLLAALLQAGPQAGAIACSSSSSSSSSSADTSPEGVDGSAGDDAPQGGGSADVVGLHWAAWAAARLVAERATGSPADAAARLQWARELAVQAQVGARRPGSMT